MCVCVCVCVYVSVYVSVFHCFVVVVFMSTVLWGGSVIDMNRFVFAVVVQMPQIVNRRLVFLHGNLTCC